jgi:hypothetical protein
MSIIGGQTTTAATGGGKLYPQVHFVVVFSPRRVSLNFHVLSPSSIRAARHSVKLDQLSVQLSASSRKIDSNLNACVVSVKQ